MVKSKNNKFDFELIDVGGQRTERRKWIHCFEDVTAGDDQQRDNLAPDCFFFIFSFVYNLPEWLQPNTVWGWNHQQNARERKSIWWVFTQEARQPNIEVYSFQEKCWITYFSATPPSSCSSTKLTCSRRRSRRLLWLWPIGNTTEPRIVKRLSKDGILQKSKNYFCGRFFKINF